MHEIIRPAEVLQEVFNTGLFLGRFQRLSPLEPEADIAMILSSGQTAVIQMNEAPVTSIQIAPSKWLTLEPNFRIGTGIIALLSLIAYWPSLGGGFVWDDMILVAKNPLVTGTSSLGNIWFAGDMDRVACVREKSNRLSRGESSAPHRQCADDLADCCAIKIQRPMAGGIDLRRSPGMRGIRGLDF